MQPRLPAPFPNTVTGTPPTVVHAIARWEDVLATVIGNSVVTIDNAGNIQVDGAPLIGGGAGYDYELAFGDAAVITSEDTIALLAGDLMTSYGSIAANDVPQAALIVQDAVSVTVWQYTLDATGHHLVGTNGPDVVQVGVVGGNDGLGFFSHAVAPQQTRGGTLTNNVTAGGTTNQVDNFTDLVVFANSAAAIRNDIYQLTRAVRMHDIALRAYGLET